MGCPGLVDVSARLREPGSETRATLESEVDAALAGGVTSLVCPPDTDPPLDEPGLIPGRPSHGCVRLPNRKVRQLAKLMPIGTPVRIR